MMKREARGQASGIVSKVAGSDGGSDYEPAVPVPAGATAR